MTAMGVYKSYHCQQFFFDNCLSQCLLCNSLVVSALSAGIVSSLTENIPCFYKINFLCHWSGKCRADQGSQLTRAMIECQSSLEPRFLISLCCLPTPMAGSPHGMQEKFPSSFKKIMLCVGKEETSAGKVNNNVSSHSYSCSFSK